MSAKESKTERIDVRTTVAAKQLLQQAAATSHKSVSEFLLENGLQAAAATLADRRLFVLDDDRWQAFQAALDRPVEDKPQLKKLLTEPGVFD
ncbi:DUF1778 domain-containing protein [Chamaesiphon sp. GL140_3_metabinner_50]|uniref:type II toxin-antitoxin system TacA family antitoxin n=1 Tax=Chamaesiphon sp. GL140_3_metabinner_50 TaxID=2970812 RepID=UPI0025E78696|nr:DUF1778 domain-containing protein [Chamaesiphon sp. GL140_3_metabinner_50]